ncbi:MAG: 6-phosphogluconolactonase [Chloroflexota bacterium]
MTAIRILPDPAAMAEAAARHIVESARAATDSRGRFSLALSGGSTPQPVHRRLAEPPFRSSIDWARVHIFFGDERCVPPDDPQSNYRMARETLLDLVPIPAENIHRMRGEADPHAAAEDYADDLSHFFRGAAIRLDLILLGMGDNGHTASLFPGLTAVREAQRPVVAESVADVGMWRITLTPLVLNQAREDLFLVTGEDKANMLRRVLEESYNPDALPAQVVRPVEGDVVWLVDAAAARRLSPPSG